MKEKFLYLIIGILVGAMCATGVFMIIDKNSSNETNNSNQTQFERRNPGNFDANNLPEGFDPNNIPEGMPGRNGNTDTDDSTNTI